ncbi:MAG: hypothetical protein RIC04_14195 [Parvibaculum sp.]|uniref:hypothetical protein n=1 Tax=Parvibaculum sp. TaxID=2024848 RepID=UPI0032EF8426
MRRRKDRRDPENRRGRAAHCRWCQDAGSFDAHHGELHCNRKRNHRSPRRRVRRTHSSGLSHVFAEQGGVIRLLQNYTISGGATHYLRTIQLGQIFAAGLTVTLIGTPAFGTAYVQAPNLAWAGVNGYTFSNSTTGTRYLADALAVILTNGGGAT